MNSRTEGEGLRRSSAWAISAAIRQLRRSGVVPVRARSAGSASTYVQAGSVASQRRPSSPNHVGAELQMRVDPDVGVGER